LQSFPDFQTNACFESAEILTWLKKVLSSAHEVVLMCYYVYRLIALEASKGARILDLGYVAGCDVYALRQMVGEQGFVVALDMTNEQLDVART
tara:strand:- start:63 stop:341 length:279 start_codon:yes stop_codon:yes gene_type:complete